MNQWEKMYDKAKDLYHPQEVNPFIYSHSVVCALEAEDGQIFTGFNIEGVAGVMNLCAERTAALNMYMNSGQTVVKRLIVFRNEPPHGADGMPCGVCRDFFMQLNIKNKDMEIMKNYETRETVTLDQLMPDWWGYCKIEEII